MAKGRFWLLGLTVLAAALAAAPPAAAEPVTVALKAGQALTIRTEHPCQRIRVADPGIAEALLISPREIFLQGKRPGTTTAIAWEDGRARTLLTLAVTLDLSPLKAKLHELFPDQPIEVHAAEGSIVLTGTVSGPEVVDQVLRLTRAFLPAAEGGRPETGNDGIVNLLRVGGVQQVLLEVRFAEVTRQSTRDWQAALGLVGQGQDLNIIAGLGGLDVTSGRPSGLREGSLLLNFAGNTANIFAEAGNLTAALKFLEEEGLARILAEPRLVTQSGQEASFLAGGEFPIPVPQTGAGGFSTITIEYKEFGVALRFTPVVMSDGRISLRVAPSVSEIADVSQIPAGIGGGDATFSVPSLATRRLETTVQLYDGQTLALAGLLQDNLSESVRKIPGLGDLPVLGALFRSSSFLQNKTDLLVAVTPHLVKPNREGTISFPGDLIQIPNRFEFYLEGRMEGRRSPGDLPAFGQHAFAPPRMLLERQGGLEGDFGHQPLTSQ